MQALLIIGGGGRRGEGLFEENGADRVRILRESTSGKEGQQEDGEKGQFCFHGQRSYH